MRAQEIYCDICLSHIQSGTVYLFTRWRERSRDSYAVCDECRNAILDAEAVTISSTAAEEPQKTEAT
jgi:hypothetical protein